LIKITHRLQGANACVLEMIARGEIKTGVPEDGANKVIGKIGTDDPTV
jgi:hypothetical protein